MSTKDCPFCEVREPVLSNQLAYVQYDSYPVSNGHLLIIPVRHVADYFDMTPEEKTAVMELVGQGKALLDQKLKHDGYNVGINSGSAAGQTVMHAHVHLIPRYRGDTDDPRGGVRAVIPEKQKY